MGSQGIAVLHSGWRQANIGISIEERKEGNKTPGPKARPPPRLNSFDPPWSRRGWQRANGLPLSVAALCIDILPLQSPVAGIVIYFAMLTSLWSFCYRKTSIAHSAARTAEKGSDAYAQLTPEKAPPTQGIYQLPIGAAVVAGANNHRNKTSRLSEEFVLIGEFPMKKMVILLVVLLLLGMTMQVALADPPGPVPASCHMNWWWPGDGPGNHQGVSDEERGMYRVHFGHPSGGDTHGAANMDIICPG